MDVKAIETTSDVPASPAGKALSAWLEVTRGSDLDAARKHYDEAFDESFHAAVPADAYMGFRAQLQGMLASADWQEFALTKIQVYDVMVAVKGKYGPVYVGNTWAGRIRQQW